jgi:hypothetical protein
MICGSNFTVGSILDFTYFTKFAVLTFMSAFWDLLWVLI